MADEPGAKRTYFSAEWRGERRQLWLTARRRRPAERLLIQLLAKQRLLA